MLLQVQGIYEINIKQAGKHNLHKIFNKLNDVLALQSFLVFWPYLA